MRNLMALFFSVLLGGGLVYGAYALYSYVRIQIASAATVEQVQEMGARLAARYDTRPNGYGTGNVTIPARTLVGFGLAPSGMAVTGSGSTTKLWSEWNGEIGVYGRQTFVWIVVRNAPGQACRAILSNLSSRSGITSVRVNATIGANGNGGTNRRVVGATEAGVTSEWNDTLILSACGEGSAKRDMAFTTGHL